MTVRRSIFPIALAATLALGLPARANLDFQPETTRSTPQDSRARRAKQRILEQAQAALRASRAKAREAQIREQIEWLSAPDRGGRAPGTPGIDQAAAMIEDAFANLRLEPAFPLQATSPDHSPTGDSQSPWRQTFPFGEKVETLDSHLSVVLPDGTIISASDDLEVSAYTSTGSFSGPISFVGYSIVTGGGDYLGFTGTESLENRAVLMLSAEPMDELGRSLWSDDGWSFAAPLHRKVNAAVRRGAKAVLVVDPPDLDTSLTGSPDPQGLTRELISPFEVPIVHIPADLADTLLRAGDPEHRGLEELYELANRNGIVVELTGVTMAVQTVVNIHPASAENIGAILPGRGALAHEFIVIGAHYDHLGLGENGSLDPANTGQVHPGADDNASGVAAMLAAADDLANRYETLPESQDARSVLFLAFSAEELGLLGSRFYVDHPVVPTEDLDLMINMDMIGRYETGGLQIGSVRSSPDLASILEPLVISGGFRIAPLDPSTAGRSDHAPFNDKGVPNLFFFTGFHDQYHTVDDTPDLVDVHGVARIASLCADVTLDVATRPERLEFDRERSGGNLREQPEDKADQTSKKVHTGLVPVVRSSGRGMAIARITPDSSADRAGLKPGDRVVSWNGQPVNSIEDWVGFVSGAKPGDRVTLEYERIGTRHTTEMTLEAEDDD